MTNNLFDLSFQLCMLYYLIEINYILLIVNISLIYKQFFAKMFLTYQKTLISSLVKYVVTSIPPTKIFT